MKNEVNDMSGQPVGSTAPENAAPAAPTAHESRKSWKARARKVVKGHYLFFVVLCLVAIYFGTEFTYVQSQTENLYDVVTGQKIPEGGQQLKSSPTSTSEQVYEDIVNDNIEQGEANADKQIEAYEKEKTDGIVGRQRGNLAPVVNVISSGKIYVLIVNGLRSAFHSKGIATAVFVILGLLLSAFVWVFLKNLYTGILRRAFLEARIYPEVPIGHLMHFRTVRRWFRASITLLVQSLFEALWSLTVVGIFIKRYSYYMVPYIVAENPDIKPLEAITLSRRMMDGHKWECCKLEISFIGWYLLGVITFGALDIFWGLPYRIATCSEYYTVRRAQAKADGIEGAQKLNDTYLFAEAEEAFLRETYADVEEQKAYIDEHRVTLTGVHAFMVKNFGLWIGHPAEKEMYEELDKRRAQIAEERAVIKGRVYPQRLNPLADGSKKLEMRNIRYLKTYTVWSVVLAFFLFGLVGWLWEVSLHLVQDGVFVNRGALHGPWLPIYGGGASLIIVLLARFRKKPVVEVLAIIVLCGVLEFFTSYFMELSKGKRWWDYTGYFLNLDGRICAEGLLVFALGGAAAVYLLMPILDDLWSKLDKRIIVVICLVLMTGFVADVIYSHFVPNEGKGITDYDAYKQTQLEDVPASDTNVAVTGHF